MKTLMKYLHYSSHDQIFQTEYDNHITGDEPFLESLKMPSNNGSFLEKHKCYHLYGLNIEELDYELGASDHECFKNHIDTPTPKKSQRQGENKYIFNYVKIGANQEKLQPKLYKEGGFNRLFVAEFEFKYISSILACEKRTLKKLMANEEYSETLKKWVMIKVPKTNSLNTHELNIVRKLKSCHSAYLLKYYEVIQSDKHASLAKKVLLDATSYPCLGEFMRSHKKTITLRTKLIILSHVAHGLRFLKNYDIVHNDLKINNILVVAKDMLIKLIDFGESYHPEVCKAKDYHYKPAYTIPYVSPERLRKEPFSSKMDIFSFGLLMHELIFSEFLFYNNEPRTKNLYRTKKYLEALYRAPEKLDHFGNRHLLRMLLSLILKCLHPDPQMRPDPLWLIVILR